MTAFTPNDTRTWPTVLTLEQVAEIYGTTPQAIQHRCKPSARNRFTPIPFKRYPPRWRKADVLRDVEGARGYSRAS